MTIIEIDNRENVSVIVQLNKFLNGTVSKVYGEEVLEFKNKLGFGIIRNISFDWGIELLDYDVYFNDDNSAGYKNIAIE